MCKSFVYRQENNLRRACLLYIWQDKAKQNKPKTSHEEKLVRLVCSAVFAFFVFSNNIFCSAREETSLYFSSYAYTVNSCYGIVIKNHTILELK